MTTDSQTPSIPAFDRIQDEADFWDTHSFASYWDELEPVHIRFTKPLAHGLTVRFDQQTLHELQKQAHKKGIGATTLIRMWVLKSLDRHRKKAAV